MALKPTELKKLVALLDDEAPSAEWLAKAVWELVEELMAQRHQYVVFAVHPSLNLVQAVGPYSTVEKAKKDYAKRIHAYDNQSFARLALLRHPDSITKD
jgi:hypothetical protein